MDDIRVGLIDDHPALRAGIAAILNQAPGFTVVAEAGSFREGENLVRTPDLDLALVDVSLPDGNGIDLIREHADPGSRVRFIVLSMHAQRQMADTAIEAGAAGYLLKDSSADVLLKGIGDVLDGRVVIDPGLRLPEDAGGCDDEPTGLEVLSPREYEVFASIAAGHGSRETAGLLRISAKTVDNHRAHIMEKLCISSVAELVRIAIRTGVIEA